MLGVGGALVGLDPVGLDAVFGEGVDDSGEGEVFLGNVFCADGLAGFLVVVAIHGDDGVDRRDVVVPAEPAVFGGGAAGCNTGSGGGGGRWKNSGNIGKFVGLKEGVWLEVLIGNHAP